MNNQQTTTAPASESPEIITPCVSALSMQRKKLSLCSPVNGIAAASTICRDVQPVQSRLKRMVLLTVALAAGLGQPVSAAITIVQPAGANYVASVPLTGLPAGTVGSVSVVPKPVPVLAPPAAAGAFMTTFAADVAEYPGWTAVAGAPLAGNLTINTYKAHDYGTPRGGADMQATYAPAAAEAGMSFAWIQMYTDNAGPGGAQRQHIDPFPNDGTDKGPFYYSNLDAGGIVNLVFKDFPSDPVNAVPFNRTVRFETYLSTFNANTKVATIYDGFSWGYDVVAMKLVAVPEPAPILSACLLTLGMLFHMRRKPAQA